MKRRVATVLSVAIMIIFLFGGKDAMAGQPDIHGQFGVSIDADSGAVLYEKNAHEKAFPASITKVLTAIVVTEHMDAGEEVVISADAAKQDPSNQVFLLKEGERMSREDALKTMMILSSNDVTYALAEHVAGSVEAFSDMMNEKVRQLGLENTHFVTPNGLHNDNHVTTAYDMAVIGREATKHPEVMELMGTKEALVKTDKREVSIKIKNKIFEENPEAVGGKTGYTSIAQNTLLEVLQKDGKQIVTVVMKTTLKDEYADIQTMSDVAFARLGKETKVKKGEKVQEETVRGTNVGLLAKEDIKSTTIDGKVLPSTSEVVLHLKDEMNYDRGDVIGEWVESNQEGITTASPLVADKAIPVASRRGTGGEGEASSRNLLLFFLLIPVATFFALNIFSNVRRLRQIRQ